MYMEVLKLKKILNHLLAGNMTRQLDGAKGGIKNTKTTLILNWNTLEKVGVLIQFKFAKTATLLTGGTLPHLVACVKAITLRVRKAVKMANPSIKRDALKRAPYVKR